MARSICAVMGIFFVIAAAWGFATHDRVLFFDVNAVHNLVHLLSGLAALACASAGERAARTFSLAFSAIYGIVTVAGFAGVDFVVRLLHLNHADNWLHLIISAVFIAAGLLSRAPLAPEAAGQPRGRATPVVP